MAATADDLRGLNRKLYDAESDPPDRESLPLRLLAYSLFNPKDFDTACRASSSWTFVDPDKLLEELIPGAAKVRAEVGERYVQPALDAIAHDYRDDDWQKLSREERNSVTDDLRGRLVDLEQAVVGEIRQILDRQGI